jgi:peptide chain release factor subunit 1
MGWNCRACSHQWETTESSSTEAPDCSKCGSSDVSEDADRSLDLVDELTLLAGRTSAKVSLISMDTEEGATLQTSFGGIAALLRYPLS